ncbi:MAG: hypothetical protein QOI80_1601, partial [Solirubrobacteraceae bacterium]|nr:hypothetical protein [Solirubrobacteraceae bacterium]
VDGIAVRIVPRWRAGRRIVPGAAFLGYCRMLFRTIGRVHTRTLVQRAASAETGLVGIATRARRRRFVYSSANVVDFSFEKLEPSRRNRLLFRLGVRLAQRVVAQTEEQVAMCRERFGRDPVLIKSVAEPGQPAGAGEAFLWIGRLAHYKRPEELLTLAEAVPEARFWMVAVAAGGIGAELEAPLRRRAEALPNVEWLEPRPRPELMELMKRAVAIVNTAEYEGMPNIFLEAWARGVPALALLHDPDGVITRHGLGAFAAGDRAAFAAQARELWQHPELRTAAGERAREYIARDHHPDRVIDHWAHVLGPPAGDR